MQQTRDINTYMEIRPFYLQGVDVNDQRREGSDMEKERSKCHSSSQFVFKNDRKRKLWKENTRHLLLYSLFFTQLVRTICIDI